MSVAFFLYAAPMRNLSILPSIDWLILSAVASIWAAVFWSFRAQRVQHQKLQNRELIERINHNSREPYEYIPVDANTVSGLRLDELQQCTDSLERLGFRCLSDHRLLGKGETSAHSFGRTLVNEQLRCYAGLLAVQKTLDAQGPLIFGFTSFLEDGWSIGSSSSSRSIRGHYVRRLPKALSVVSQGVSPEQLFQRHLELRDRVMKDLGIGTVPDISLEGLRERVRSQMEERRHAFSKRDVLEEWPKAWRLAKKGQWEWLGEYPQEVTRRSKAQKLHNVPRI